MFVSPGEIAFYLGSIPVYCYGLIMALSLTLGILVSDFVRAKFYPDLDKEIVYDIAPIIILSAILGARLYYCILSWDYFSKNISEVFQVWHGGISIHGAIIGGLIGGVFYAKKHKLPVMKLCDIFSYGLILGQALGRWGNFFNSEAFGRPCDCFLKLYIPIYKRPIQYIQYDYFHPTFLYESVLDILVFLILFFVVRKLAKGKDGVVFFSYLILYSVVRIIVESFRIDSVLNILGIPVAQLVSVLIIIIGFVGLVYCNKKNKKQHAQTM